MEREKQIMEEMANILNQGIKPLKETYSTTELATILYNAGYRKEGQGEWKHPPYAPFGGSYEMKRCSVCGYKPDFDSDNPYTKFCPHCGAHMKGSE